MPWKTSDVDKFKKGLTSKQKQRWVSVANNALKECVDKGGNQLDCEASAIRIANSKFSETAVLGKTRYLDGEVEEEGGLRRETRLRLTTTDASATDDYQMILPVGVFYSDWYGEIIITNSYIEAMVQNWQRRVMGNREPFIDTLHDRGKANGWIEDLEARDDGLYAKIRWTKQGRENIEEEYFKYFSADLGQVTHLETGDTVWPVLFAVALCNTPVMNTMPQAHLSEPAPKQDPTPAHGDGGSHRREGNTMTLKELLEGFKELELTEDDKKQIAEVAGISLAEPEQKPDTEKLELSERVTKLEEQNATLKETNAQLSAAVKELRAKEHAERKKAVIDKALAEGKILPKDKETWEARFDKDPDFTAEIIEGLPAVVDMSVHGTGAGGGEPVQMSANERKVHQMLGHSDEDIKKYGGE